MATYDLKYPGAAIDAILDTAYDLQNAGYIFRGPASEYSNTPTERSWVLAGEGETGHGFTSPVPKGYIGVCVFNGTSWTGKLLKCVSIDSAPTNGSTNAVSSGGVYASINNLATFINEALDNLTFTDTTPSAFLGDYIKMKVSTTDGGLERILTYFTILAATASKAGLLSAADKTKLDALWSSGYQFVGIATPSTTPVSTTSKIFYIATEAGTYFNAVTVTQGINILSWNGTTWSAVQVVGIDDEPTIGSSNLVESSGVKYEISGYYDNTTGIHKGVFETYVEDIRIYALDKNTNDGDKVRVRYLGINNNSFGATEYEGYFFIQLGYGEVTANYEIKLTDIVSGEFNKLSGVNHSNYNSIDRFIVYVRFKDAVNTQSDVFTQNGLEVYCDINDDFDRIVNNFAAKHGITYINPQFKNSALLNFIADIRIYADNEKSVASVVKMPYFWYKRKMGNNPMSDVVGVQFDFDGTQYAFTSLASGMSAGKEMVLVPDVNAAKKYKVFLVVSPFYVDRPESFQYTKNTSDVDSVTIECKKLYPNRNTYILPDSILSSRAVINKYLEGIHIKHVSPSIGKLPITLTLFNNTGAVTGKFSLQFRVDNNPSETLTYTINIGSTVVKGWQEISATNIEVAGTIFRGATLWLNFATDTIDDESVIAESNALILSPLGFDCDDSDSGSVITLKKSGGDYSTVRAALEAASSGTTIEIYPGTYELTDEYTETEIKTAFIGWQIPNGVTLKGVGRKEDIILSCDLPSSLASQDTINPVIQFYTKVYRAVSVINMMANGELDNLTVKGRNCWYCNHDDWAGSSTAINRKVKNCDFLMQKPSDPSYSSAAYGMGIPGGGCNFTFEDCNFISFSGCGFYGHNRVSRTVPIKLSLISCVCESIGDNSSQDSDMYIGGVSSTEDGVVDMCHIENCVFLRRGLFVKDNQTSGSEVRNWKVEGFGNHFCPSRTEYPDSIGNFYIDFHDEGCLFNTDDTISKGHPVQLVSSIKVAGFSNGTFAGVSMGDTDNGYIYVKTRGYVHYTDMGLASVSLGDMIGISNGQFVKVTSGSYIGVCDKIGFVRLI